MTEFEQLKKVKYHMAIFTVSKLISSLGANVLAFGIALYILQMTGSATSFSINLLCTILPRVILAPFVGYLADRYNKKFIVMSGQIMMIVTIASLLLYSEIYGISVIAIYIMTIFYSAFSSFSGIALTASIGNLIHPDYIQKTMSLNQMSISVGSIGAPIIGGMLFGFVSMEVFLIIQIVCFSIATLLDATMNFKLFSSVEEKLNDVKASFIASTKNAIKYVKTKQVLRTVLLLSLSINFIFSAIGVGLSFIIIEVMKIEPLHVGWVEGVGAIGMLLGSIYLSMRKQIEEPLKFSKNSLIAFSFILALITVPLYINSTNYVFNVIYFMITFFLLFASEIFINIPVGVVLQTSTDEAYRGRVFALLETMAMGLMPLGTLFFGIIFDLVEAQYVISIVSVVAIGVTMFMLRPTILKKISRELAKNRNENHAEKKETVKISD